MIDRFGRRISYLRVSVTDRCNFRCVYCMSEQMTFLPREELLTLEETAWIARAFTEMGVDKIRITGGEPLVRHNILKLFGDLGALPGLRELTLTTNGSLLQKYATDLREMGVRRVNISLDSLKPDRFRKLARWGELSSVLTGIDAALAAGFERIKINAVILRGRNEDEVCDLAEFAGQRGMDISYIEEMPLGAIEEHDRSEAYYSSDSILSDLQRRFRLRPDSARTGGPSHYYCNEDTGTRVGFISPHSHNFCGDCNRVRLTCEGRLLLCLGQEHSTDLRSIVRQHGNDMEPLQHAISQAMNIKPEGHDFNLQEKPIIMRYMNMTGG